MTLVSYPLTDLLFVAAILLCCLAEFVLAVGNDTNDEEMFTTLNDLLATVKKQSDTAHGSMKPPLSSGVYGRCEVTCDRTIL